MDTSNIQIPVNRTLNEQEMDLKYIEVLQLKIQFLEEHNAFLKSHVEFLLKRVQDLEYFKQMMINGKVDKYRPDNYL